jgi:hypothetical protein
MAKVQLFEDDNCIGMVDYTDNLDRWDGHNMTSGSSGRHLGIGRCKKGWYVCNGTQWQGERDNAQLISEEEAKQLCLNHNPEKYQDLFGEKPPDLM